LSGKPQYDEATVVDAAMNVFWRHGYAAASINELTAATGLSRSSLYQRFRDKDGLFHEALSNYTERLLRHMKEVEADTARGRLEALLREFAPKPGKSKRPVGCLLAKCCAEMPDLTEAGQSLALAGLARQRAVIESILREAVSNGELPEDADIEGLAWHYLGVLQAIVTLPQAGATSDALQRMIHIAMSVWPEARRKSARAPK
jgi:TetR/AcrR family transcriptional regulator, copper-responsive repressor